MSSDHDGSRDVDDYVAGFDPHVRDALRSIREAIREIVPEAREGLAYGIPTFTQGRHLVHFGAFKTHIGFYPTPSGLERFDTELARYARGKGSARFPLDEPMPLDLVRDIVRYRVQEEAKTPKPSAKARPRKAAAAPPMSDAAIERRTGRGWQAWLDVLTAWGAAERTHTEIAAWLVSKHDVDGWSAQSITVAFERAHGGRDLGQRPDGFEASVSKTVPVAVAVLYRAFMDEALRSRWLPDGDLRPRTATEPKSARFDWGDGATRVHRHLHRQGAREELGDPHARPAPRRRGGRREEGVLARARGGARGGRGGGELTSSPRA